MCWRVGCSIPGATLGEFGLTIAQFSRLPWVEHVFVFMIERRKEDLVICRGRGHWVFDQTSFKGKVVGIIERCETFAPA